MIRFMTVELDEVQHFLAENAPYAQLPAESRALLTRSAEIRYCKRGSVILRCGESNDLCWVIRSGAVDITDENGVLLDRREAGRSFGYSTILGENRNRYSMIAVEDSLLITITRADFLAVAEKDASFTRFFSSQSTRMRAAAEQVRNNDGSQSLRAQLGDFMTTQPATLHPTESIQSAARVMRDKNVSSLVIATDEDICGIVTDRDLRSKVVADDVDVTMPVSGIMTLNPITATTTTPAFEAMMIMAEHGIHHLPVRDITQSHKPLVGIVSSPDIMRLLRNDPIYITADISRRSSAEELSEVFARSKDVAARFVERSARPEEVSALLSHSADAVARRLLSLAEEELGPPPVPYAFVVVGSQGRKELGFASDQDNALILSNAFKPEEHGEYFTVLANRVCQGLALAGQVLCPGDMMASNPQWRLTESEWISTFTSWITAPEPEALMFAQTFFDMRLVHGDESLYSNVRASALDQARSARRFHAHLATVASRREPPLGFFRGFVVERGGDYAHTLDIKKGGIHAIVQMARLYALTCGADALGTRQRLNAAASLGAVSEKGAHDLLDAFDVLNTIAFDHQATDLRVGNAPSYHVDPEQLGKMDREHVRDAFHIIKGMQQALSTKYPTRSM